MRHQSLRRDDGSPVQIGDRWWVENDRLHFAAPVKPQPFDPDEHWQLLPAYEKQLAQEVPNRLKGTTINHEGDAV